MIPKAVGFGYRGLVTEPGRGAYQITSASDTPNMLVNTSKLCSPKSGVHWSIATGMAKTRQGGATARWMPFPGGAPPGKRLGPEGKGRP